MILVYIPLNEVSTHFLRPKGKRVFEMESVLQKKIKNYLETNKVSVTALEREAGLKSNVARNILRGISKKPTAVTLRAIADVMGCTVEDLLGGKTETHKSEMKSSSERALLLEAPELLDNSLHALLQIIKANNYTLTVQQTLFILGEVYAYSIKKDPPKIDEDFIEWFIKLGGRIRYDIDIIKEFEKEQLRQHTSMSQVHL